MYVIVVKKIPTHKIRTHDEKMCGPAWDTESQVKYKKCQSTMAILAATGIENYTVKTTLIKKGMKFFINKENNVDYVHTLDDTTLLKYDTFTNTYSSTLNINLNQGLNIIFWCNRALHPTTYSAESTRLGCSDLEHLHDGVNIQFTPGDDQVWDTYLLNEAKLGYSGKTDASPICDNGEQPFLCTDRITVSRKRNEPSGLLQQSWLTAITNFAQGKNRFTYYDTRRLLPIYQFPPLAQEVSFFHLIKLRSPIVESWIYKDLSWDLV